MKHKIMNLFAQYMIETIRSLADEDIYELINYCNSCTNTSCGWLDNQLKESVLRICDNELGIRDIIKS